MDLRYTDHEEAFRAELRAWLAEALPQLPPEPSPDDWPGRRAHGAAWQRMLFEAGYAGIHWPVAFGGRGATPTEHLVFLEETEAARAPDIGTHFVGQLHAGPTIIAEGTDAQRAAHLPAILRGDEIWCQGFSEPEAGSDLASLRTRAVRDGDHYVVTGQKIWTSQAQVADYCELLVRTDPTATKHAGISWLMLRMDRPGIEIRPLRTIAGTTEFSEVFLDEVRVPVTDRIGEENDGWRVANVTLRFERGTALVSELLRSQVLLADLAALARTTPRGDGTAWDDAGVRRELGRLCAELDGLVALTKRTITQAARTGVPGVGGSLFKLRYTDVRARMSGVAMRVLGPAGHAFDDLDRPGAGAQVEAMIQGLSLGIAAGTSQVQRNIVAERILGLPREPKAVA